ncbi:hypothetical protein RSal33209_0481 [Renibacterium salmoninarum ATCC 33209]|uniref:Uncharacterized protein n=1 Tax=Renibacterium salmoninarum (strain ATCC 33209 / DSM 20767 / JCM 11484 / NBRC 15589 / NCIMB 2235) TaxID=288705 RepID=A9WM99_RENSM|nr:hypothetical protein RSal33209_0481 [Renibacterium salmoninarum ATCC 33209]
MGDAPSSTLSLGLNWFWLMKITPSSQQHSAGEI